MNNTYKIKHKGVTYENPLVKVLEVAKEKGIDYEASLDLIPDEYDMLMFLDLVRATGVNYTEYYKKLYVWQELIKELNK